MNLQDWANRWGVPPQAIAELAMCNHGEPEPLSRAGVESESALQSLVRLEAARKGVWLGRNNVGALKNEKGRLIRYGLANDSKNVNTELKTGDLIGFRPRLIKSDDVGSIIAQFVSRECKRPDWVFSNTLEEQAQLRWMTLVNANGGDAAMVNFEGSL